MEKLNLPGPALTGTNPLTHNSLIRAYKNLTPKTRAAVGLGIIAWGGFGLYLSDQAEERFGFSPTAQDKEELEKLKPRIITVDRDLPR